MSTASGRRTWVFGVSSGAYYRWAKQGVSMKRSKRDAGLVDLIREIVTGHHFRYGSPRARETLRNDYGKRVGLKKAARLMRENGLNARLRGKFIPATNSNHGLEVCENLLNREFQAATAGAKRVSDITCLRVPGGRIYLTTVPDLYDRKVIGRAFGSDMETARTTIPAYADGLCPPLRSGGHGVPFRPGVAVLLKKFLRRFERMPPHGPPEHEMRRETVGTMHAPNLFSKR